MKTRLLLYFLLVIISNNFYSRKKHIIELKNDSSQFSNFNFHISEVIDDRFQNESFGFIVFGMFDIKREADFKDGVTLSFKNYIDRLIVKNDGSERIKLRIRELKISESESIDDNGTCKLVLEFLDSLDNLIYMTEFKGSIPITESSKNIDKLVANLLNKSLLLFSLYDRNERIYFDLLSNYNLFDSIILCKHPRKGFYTNFKEFQANNPSIKEDFEIISFNEKGRQYSRIRFEDPMFNSNKFLDLIYGFSDGKSIYVKRYINNQYYTFIPIEILGRYSYIGKKYESQGVPFILPFAFGYFTIPYQEDYILNLSSGAEHPLKEETLKLILLSDQELYNAYQNQPYEKREETKLYWLEQFNKRYKDRVKTLNDGK